MIQTQHNITPKILRSDGGAEFYSSRLTDFLTTNSILHQKSCPYTPQQNGLAERKHRHILDTTRALMFDAHLPPHLWADSILTATHLINLMPSSKSTHQSPYQLLYQSPPAYNDLRVFGCACYPLIPSPICHKFQPRTTQCVFIGYPSNIKGYKCLHPSSGRVYISRHVIFDENLFPFKHSTKSLLPTTTNAEISSTAPLLLTPSSSVTTPNPATSKSPLPYTHQSPHLTPILNDPISPSPSILSSNNSPLCPDHHSHSSSPIPLIHLMITCARTGSLKPKPIFDLLHTTNTPTSLAQASKSAHCATPCLKSSPPCKNRAHGTLSHLLPLTPYSVAAGPFVSNIMPMAQSHATKHVL